MSMFQFLYYIDKTMKNTSTRELLNNLFSLFLIGSYFVEYPRQRTITKNVQLRINVEVMILQPVCKCLNFSFMYRASKVTATNDAEVKVYLSDSGHVYPRVIHKRISYATTSVVTTFIFLSATFVVVSVHPFILVRIYIYSYIQNYNPDRVYKVILTNSGMTRLLISFYLVIIATLLLLTFKVISNPAFTFPGSNLTT